jgi:hypothetical protein
MSRRRRVTGRIRTQKTPRQPVKVETGAILPGILLCRSSIAALETLSLHYLADTPDPVNNRQPGRHNIDPQTGGSAQAADIVKRAIGWLNRCRYLAKAWEYRNRSVPAVPRDASIRLMERKL